MKEVLWRLSVMGSEKGLRAPFFEIVVILTPIVVSNPKGEPIMKGVSLRQINEIMQDYEHVEKIDFSDLDIVGGNTSNIAPPTK